MIGKGSNAMSRFSGGDHVRSAEHELSRKSIPSALFGFLFEYSHVCLVNLCEMRSYALIICVWNLTKPKFQPYFMFENEMKDLLSFRNSKWQRP